MNEWMNNVLVSGGSAVLQVNSADTLWLTALLIVDNEIINQLGEINKWGRMQKESNI